MNFCLCDIGNQLFSIKKSLFENEQYIKGIFSDIRENIITLLMSL